MSTYHVGPAYTATVTGNQVTYRRPDGTERTLPARRTHALPLHRVL